MRNGLANATSAMHPAFVAGGLLDAERRMHHHHHDDAEALGVVDPVDPAGLRRVHNALSVPLALSSGCGFGRVYGVDETGAHKPRHHHRPLLRGAIRPRGPEFVNHDSHLMRVAMIGTGYVGLVSGACFADFGHHVTCVDKDAGKIAALERGEMPIYEPGLDDLVAANVKAGRLSFTTELKAAGGGGRAVFIAVGTPSRRGDGHADLSYVHAAAKEIAAALDGFTVVITKSTVPVGTGDEVERIIRETRPDADFAVVSNPEFLREGAAIQDFKHPDRIVVGTEDARAAKVMAELYRPLYLNRSPIVITGPPHRRADQIRRQCFPRHQDHLHQRDRGSVREGRRRRAGGRARHRASTTASAASSCTPGPGFGGSCFPKDTLALIKTGQDHERRSASSRPSSRSTIAARRAMARKVAAALGIEPARQDRRGAWPHLQAEHRRHARRAFDPADHGAAGHGRRRCAPTIRSAWSRRRRCLPNVTYCDDAYDCAKGADALVIVTEWEQFRALDLDRLKQVMATSPRSSICATSIGLRRCASAASSTKASAGPGPRGTELTSYSGCHARESWASMAHGSFDTGCRSTKRCRALTAALRQRQHRGAGGAARRRQDHARAAVC